MNAQKAPERQQQQASQSQNATLNERYGKIGISAVAGAVQHRGETRAAAEKHFTVRESD